MTSFRSNFENKAAESITKCGNKIMSFRTWVKKPIYGVHETENSQQKTEGVGEFHIGSSENITSTFTITFFGTNVGVFLVLMFSHKVKCDSIKIH